MFARLVLVALVTMETTPGVGFQSRTAETDSRSRTAVIAGRVVSADQSPQPIRRARVTVADDGGVSRTVMTDDEGHFAVEALAAGRYTVSATKPGSLRAAYGAARPGRPGVSIPLAAGERVTDIALMMAKGGVITGTVTDSNGRRALGVPVRLLQYRYEGGQRVATVLTLPSGSAAEVTDDRGEYRFFGLMPGDYVIGIAPGDPSGGELRGAGGTVGYVPVYYPGATAIADARPVTVGAGEEISGIDVAMQYVRTARIEGAITGPDFPSKDLRVTLLPDTKPPISTGALPVASLVASLRMLSSVASDRTFSFSGIAPGHYAIFVQGVEPVPRTPTTLYADVINGRPVLWGIAEVDVDGADLTGVTIDLRPGLAVSGRVVLEGATTMTPPADPTKVRVSLLNAMRLEVGFSLGYPTATVSASGRFTITNVSPGAYRAGASYSGDTASNWSVSSVTLDGRNVLDFPLEVTPNAAVNDLVVTLTRATQQVSGVLQDAAGRPAPGLTVVLFPSDRGYWQATRRIRTARSGRDGRYSFDLIPSGDYRLAAVVDINPGEQGDPAFLESLVPSSVLIVVKPGERKLQNLRINR